MAQTNNSPAVIATNTSGPSNPRDSRIIDDRKADLPKNVGHLLKEPVEIDCPACHKHNVTRVHKTAVTFCQLIVAGINALCCCCKDPIKWEGRFDYNHFCSECGCYIGRYISLGWNEKRMLREKRMELEIDHIVDKMVDRATNNMREQQQSGQTSPYGATTVPNTGTQL
ncbi:uncharacterized protein [Musca autumnalis]|uniref:uncharacterized protein n=1 Tax=Musca autumnalis TaxID=221902 RepID=UPI003CEE5673